MFVYVYCVSYVWILCLFVTEPELYYDPVID